MLRADGVAIPSCGSPSNLPLYDGHVQHAGYREGSKSTTLSSVPTRDLHSCNVLAGSGATAAGLESVHRPIAETRVVR